MNEAPRFEDTLICEDCNKVDSSLKILWRKAARRAGREAGPDWSLAPAEIALIVTATPHGRHLIDTTKGLALVAQLLTTGNPR